MADGGDPMPHVLVVDDQPDVCTTVEMGLRELGRYRVSVAHTGDEALPILDQDKPDLVLLDAVMRGMPATEFAICSSRRGIPLIMMTGHPQAIERLELLGWPYLRKPFHLDQLLTKCAAAISEGKQNLVVVRAALDRCLKQGELAQIIGQARRSVDRSQKRRPDWRP